MIDDRPDISLLTQWLEPLVDWKQFGLCLVRIKEHDVSKIEQENTKIEDRKLALYSKWLKVEPKATWADVINALNKTEENKLAQDIRRKSFVAFVSSPKKTVKFHSAESEKEIMNTLNGLKKEFSILVMHAQLGLEEKIEKNPKILRGLIIWLQAHMHWNDKLKNRSLEETFESIHPFYDFIDCSLIVDMSEVFLKDFKFNDDVSIVFQLKEYKKKTDQICVLDQVKHLNEALQTIYERYIPDTSNMPMILMKLHNPWDSSDVNGLFLLICKFFPVGYQESIRKHITVSFGSVNVTSADSIIEYTGGKLQFMHLIGIFSLYINDHPFLQEDVNRKLNFGLEALVEAVTTGNDKASEFLTHLELDRHTNSEGKTALMFACERGHEDIVRTLLSAGANVNIQDNKGWTALMIASKHNHISIIHMLLQVHADGSDALLIASYYGNYEVVELLISKGVDYNYQREDGANAFMLACQNGHNEVVKLLLMERVDPNVQNKEGLYCLLELMLTFRTIKDGLH
uniref:Death domain-containing protein n=1 Tax=Amphimedon queenslandica TaxID=400682 RepID=A0A1X7THF6_AMPQE